SGPECSLFAQSLNRYVYVGNTPTVLTDQTGACLGRSVARHENKARLSSSQRNSPKTPHIFLDSEVMRHDGSRPMTGSPNLQCGSSSARSDTSYNLYRCGGDVFET